MMAAIPNPPGARNRPDYSWVVTVTVFLVMAVTWGIAGGFFRVPAQTEEYDHIAEGGFHSPAEDPLTTFSIDVDTASYANASGGVNVDLEQQTATGDAGDDTLCGIENVLGSGHADTLAGDSGDNSINAGAGNDIVDAGAGNDTVVGDAGNDTLMGGEGTDTLDLSDVDADIAVNLQDGTANSSETGDDIISGFENLVTGAGDDTVTGSTANDTISTGEGADTIDGGDGIDLIDGGAGNDVIADGAGSDMVLAGYGEDTVVAGSGNDSMDGGEGTDTLDMSNASSDAVVDLSAGTATSSQRPTN